MSSLYVHIPFCERKCIYCSFYSIESFDGKDRFLAGLEREIAMRAEALGREGITLPPVDSLFFGGGTPSMLSPEEIGGIIRQLEHYWPLAEGAEVTMECNPGTVVDGWMEGYRDVGINRLSFGVQSFHDDELAFLSRIHTAEEAKRTIALGRRTFANVSLDLIFALPAQTSERWRETLRQAIDLGTDHVSAYSLIFEEGTRLNAMRRAGSVRPAPEGLEADMYEETMDRLGGEGFEQYEVSNYARPGRACRHNVGYWERRTYLAFGPSAHGFLREATPPRRWANVSNLSAWLQSVERGELPEVSREELTPTLELEEAIYLGLRSGGIILPEFRRLAGAELAERAPRRIAQMLEGGYALLEQDRFRLTRRGYPFADRFALQVIEEVGGEAA